MNGENRPRNINQKVPEIIRVAAVGPQAALEEAEKLKLQNNHFYYVLLGELYKNLDGEKAKCNFQKAYALAKTQTEKKGIQEKIDGLS